jgi:hypothetical protein
MGDNGASAFAYEGFHLNKDWPGTDVKDGVEVHHPTVTNLLKALDEDITRLKGVNAGTVRHLRVYGTVTAQHVGEWDAAQQLGTVFTQGHTALTGSYDKLIAQYEAAITVIKTSFDNILKAEKSSDVGRSESA